MFVLGTGPRISDSMTLDVFVFFVPFDYKVDETKEESMRNYGHAVNQSTVGLCLTPL